MILLFVIVVCLETKLKLQLASNIAAQVRWRWRWRWLLAFCPALSVNCSKILLLHTSLSAYAQPHGHCVYVTKDPVAKI